jgi:hypothetical protein
MVAEITANSKENSHNIILPDAIYSRQQLSWLCSWMTLIRWEQAGKLKRIGRGRVVRYRGCDLLAALQSK